MSTCPAVELACPQCVFPRQCDGECSEMCRLLVEMLSDPEGHEALHRSQHCSGCGTAKYDAEGNNTDVTRTCRYGLCTEWHCPVCDLEWGAAGPVGCRCSTGWTTRLWLAWRRFRDRRSS